MTPERKAACPHFQGRKTLIEKLFAPGFLFESDIPVSVGLRGSVVDLGITHKSAAALAIPKGLCHLAQGWRAERLPWVCVEKDLQPQRGLHQVCD